MSVPAQKPVTQQAVNTRPVQLWVAQILAILRIELKKNLMKKRNIWIYLLAFGPVVVIALHVLLGSSDPGGLSEDTNILADIFQLFYLRLAIFFGCMILFTWLYRGEVVEKSLHYYFLAPVRREILIIGKFLAGAITATFIFGLAFFCCFGLMYAHYGRAGMAFVFSGPGLGQLFAYLGVTALACLGYGSVFLALSLIIKNPILPGAAVLLWETFHAVLPSLLQKFSVMFYLKQLCPVSLLPDDGLSLFIVITEPVSPWLAVPGLLCLCAAILIFACFRIRRTEISYLAD
jgi:ABC-type transport system involved in multi-copper enzyme maturation permease subunit